MSHNVPHARIPAEFKVLPEVNKGGSAWFYLGIPAQAS